MQSPGIDILDFHRFFELDQSISTSPLNPGISLPPSTEEPSHPPPEANRNRIRNPRSCDFCRMRKTACIIQSEPPCTTCRSKGKECLFTERPQKRRRPNVIDPASEIQVHAALSSQANSTLIPAQNVVPPEPPAPPRSVEFDCLPLDSIPIRADRRSTTQSPGSDSRQANPTRRSSSYGNELEESLDMRPTSMAFLLGEAGEADPYLLGHPSLAAHAENMKFRQIHRDKDALNEGEQRLDTERPLVFMLGEHSLYDQYEPRVEDSVLRGIREELDRISDVVGIRLVMLYFDLIYPYFPILSRSQMLGSEQNMKEAVSSLPLSLKAALYASAIPFMVYDDYLSTMLDVNPPSTQTLNRMAWTAITHEAHTPHLSTLQACLLLLQRDNVVRFVQCSPFHLSLVAWTVGLAQALGLSTDCSTWRGIPAWEKRLRRRLWWATYVLDKWMLLTAGLSTHVKDDDFDVLPLTAADFVSDADVPGFSSVLPHFAHLVGLTTILSDIHHTFFTLKASKATSRDFGHTLELGKRMRSRLYSWKESFDLFHSPRRDPESRTKLDGNVSLGVAYHAVTMLLFRAMIRPLESPYGTMVDMQTREDRGSVRLEARESCAELVEYLERIQPGAWNAFWHKFSRSNFAIASSFMMRLYITSTSQDEANALKSLIDRWRWAMRIGGGSTGSQLTSLGLLRLDRTLLRSRTHAAER